jgi:hypothetical protein
MYTFNSKEELSNFIASEIVNTSEACELLNCSRQNLDRLVKLGTLVPIKVYSTSKLFFKSDILERAKESPKAGRPKKDTL